MYLRHTNTHAHTHTHTHWHVFKFEKKKLAELGKKLFLGHHPRAPGPPLRMGKNVGAVLGEKLIER